MATSPQQPFFGGGHSIRNLSTMAMATSLQWPFFGGADTPYRTSLQWPWPPLYNGHFLGADTPYGTSLQWPFFGGRALHMEPLYTMVMATSLQWPFFGGGHSIWNLSSMATFFCPQGGHCERFNCVQKGYLLCQKWYTAISR